MRQPGRPPRAQQRLPPRISFWARRPGGGSKCRPCRWLPSSPGSASAPSRRRWGGGGGEEAPGPLVSPPPRRVPPLDGFFSSSLPVQTFLNFRAFFANSLFLWLPLRTWPAFGSAALGGRRRRRRGRAGRHIGRATAEAMAGAASSSQPAARGGRPGSGDWRLFCSAPQPGRPETAAEPLHRSRLRLQPEDARGGKAARLPVRTAGKLRLLVFLRGKAAVKEMPSGSLSSSEALGQPRGERLRLRASEISYLFPFFPLLY